MPRQTDIWKILDRLSTIVLLVAAVVAIRVLFAGQPLGDSSIAARPELPSEPIMLDASRSMGSPNAKVSLVVYSDFECSFCGRFAKEILPAISRDYIAPGKVRLTFKHFPSEQTHPSALNAAAATECASRQGAFWPMHDRIFAASSVPNRTELKDLAASLGLSLDSYQQCLDGEVVERIRSEAKEAGRLGVRGTPWFWIGTLDRERRMIATRVIVGIRPADQFFSAFDDLISS